jgi:hypothetical protein
MGQSVRGPQGFAQSELCRVHVFPRGRACPTDPAALVDERERPNAQQANAKTAACLAKCCVLTTLRRRATRPDLLLPPRVHVVRTRITVVSKV